MREALAQARPGETIRIAPGDYRGGVTGQGLRGEPGKPIILKASDPKRPPVFKGGTTGLHLSRVSHLELHDLIVIGATGNGINIDDGGTLDRPSHHILLRNLVIRDIGPTGNRDGIKLSGVDDFRVEGCTVERWGSGGSGIDMVGCHRGEIVGCTFRHGDTTGDSGVQAKGGSREIVIRRCRFEHAGQRAVNLGGSTGLAFFRPKPEGYEAKDITVEDCTFNGSMTPVAFVGVDGASRAAQHDLPPQAVGVPHPPGDQGARLRPLPQRTVHRQPDRLPLRRDGRADQHRRCDRPPELHRGPERLVLPGRTRPEPSEAADPGD